jgi:hypothetical protein
MLAHRSCKIPLRPEIPQHNRLFVSGRLSNIFFAIILFIVATIFVGLYASVG